MPSFKAVTTKTQQRAKNLHLSAVKQLMGCTKLDDLSKKSHWQVSDKK